MGFCFHFKVQFLLWNRIWDSPGWPQTLYVAEDDLEFWSSWLRLSEITAIHHHSQLKKEDRRIKVQPCHVESEVHCPPWEGLILNTQVRQERLSSLVWSYICWSLCNPKKTEGSPHTNTYVPSEWKWGHGCSKVWWRRRVLLWFIRMEQIVTFMLIRSSVTIEASHMAAI